jgi:hypothetical protein
LVAGYVRAEFSFRDAATVNLNLGVLVKRTDAGWRIQQYQVSPVV